MPNDYRNGYNGQRRTAWGKKKHALHAQRARSQNQLTRGGNTHCWDVPAAKEFARSVREKTSL